MNVVANRLAIKLFEGPTKFVEEQVSEWLHTQPASVSVVSVEYNYQGAERNYDPEQGVTWEPPSHGVLVVYDLGTSQREEKG